jgi:hypothetical protein
VSCFQGNNALAKLNTPVLSGAKQLEFEPAILSRLADDYPELKLIVVDDRSCDATGAIAAPDVRYSIDALRAGRRVRFAQPSVQTLTRPAPKARKSPRPSRSPAVTGRRMPACKTSTGRVRLARPQAR